MQLYGVQMYDFIVILNGPTFAENLARLEQSFTLLSIFQPFLTKLTMSKSSSQSSVVVVTTEAKKDRLLEICGINSRFL